jgi:hypothetical protein
MHTFKNKLFMCENNIGSAAVVKIIIIINGSCQIDIITERNISYAM